MDQILSSQELQMLLEAMTVYEQTTDATSIFAGAQMEFMANPSSMAEVMEKAKKQFTDARQLKTERCVMLRCKLIQMRNSAIADQMTTVQKEEA